MNSPLRSRIAIVGGGLGGLACARVLQRHGREVTVFENEESLGARSQGGTLDMHAGTGQVALRAAGLFQQFEALARPEGQESRRVDGETAELLQREMPTETDYYKPEIDRGQLRGLLLDSLTADTVRWDSAVREVTSLGDGTWRVHLGDGTAEDFDLVIGADGAWSRVRPALTAATPDYTGVVFVEAGFDDSDTRHTAIAEQVGDGMMVAKAHGQTLFGQRNSNGHIRLYAGFRAPADWHVTADVDLGDTEAVRAHLLERYEGWHESLLDFFRDNDGDFINRPLYALPAPLVWDHVPGVTLIGDAAHLMPPLGLGANLALLDGVELAAAIAAEPTLDDAVRAYERVMLPRSTEAAVACGQGLIHLMPLATTVPS